MKTTRIAAVGVLLLVSACSGGSSKPAAQATTPAGTTTNGPTITIKGFRYTPLQVAPGTTITVKNLDSAEHTVTADTKGAFEQVEVSDTPKTFTAPTKPGTYTYHCIYHASMHGSLTVT